MDPPNKKRTQLPVSQVLFCVLSLLIVLAMNSTLSNRTPGSRGERDAYTYPHPTVQNSILINCILIPTKIVDFNASAGGHVEAVFAEAGTMIELGNPILRLGNSSLLLEAMTSEAELFQKSNQLLNLWKEMEDLEKNARDMLAKVSAQVRKVQEKELSPKENLLVRFKQDSMSTRMRIARLEESIRHMAEEAKAIKQKLDGLTVRAPISGILNMPTLSRGKRVLPKQWLGKVEALNNFKVYANVEGSYLDRVHVGLTGESEFAGRNYELVVKEIDAKILNDHFAVEMEFVNREPEDIQMLRQTIDVRLLLSNKYDSLAAPQSVR